MDFLRNFVMKRLPGLLRVICFLSWKLIYHDYVSGTFAFGLLREWDNSIQ